MASSELGDPTPLDNLESLDKSTISVDNLQSLSITPQSNDISKSCRKIRRLQFVLHDTHMARIIDLLRVDLGAIDKTAKLKKGRARVDRQWISKFITVDWSQAFTEEGHLRLTCFFDMLPKLVSGPDAHSSLCQSYRRVQTAALGLADYNMRHKVLPTPPHIFFILDYVTQISRHVAYATLAYSQPSILMNYLDMNAIHFVKY